MNRRDALIINMRHYWMKVFVIIGAIAILIGFSIAAFNLYRLLYRPLLIEPHEPIIIQINKSTSASSFVHILSTQHLIQSERLFLIFIRMQGFSQQLKAGVYQIRAGETAQQFLYRVVRGDGLTQTFSIIEGTTQAQVAANLEHAPYLIYHANDWLPISANLPNAEGLLLADTYHYHAGSQSKNLLELAHKNLQQFLEHCWQTRIAGLPYKNSYELLVAASILEKEAAKPRERRLIAGIIANRLHKNMPLQMDPTVIYALGTNYKGTLTRADLHVDSPYNSYRYRGLPPTPIAMVGKDAIDAAAHPEVTDYLYFVATGDGSHYFSTTYEQQMQAVARYRRR